MSTEYKLGAAAVGLIVLLGTIVMFANQPKNEKDGLPFDKGGAGAGKTAADKTVSSPGAGSGAPKPSAPTIPTAKLSNSPARPAPSTSIESPVTPAKPDSTLPPVVATAPPARRTTETSSEPPLKAPDTTSPTGGSAPTANAGSGGPGSSPGLGAPGSNTPTVSTPATGDPPRPTVTPPSGAATPGGNTPAGGNSTTGSGSTAPPRSDPAKPAAGGKPSVYDTEIERPPSSVADLAGRTSGGTRSADPRGSTTPGERPLTPSGRGNEVARGSNPATEAKPVPGKPYKIQPGDRLSVIARQKYGDASYVSLIKQANPGLNENRIFAGSTIILPDAPGDKATTPGSNDKPQRPGRPETDSAASGSDKPAAGNVKREASARLVGDESKPESVDKTQAGTAGGTYIVRRGDTLRKIAKAKLNDENRWREIFALNKAKLSSGDALEIGMPLQLPPAEQAPENKPRTRTP